MSELIALVIEDHDDISTLFRMVLQEAGFETDVIQDGHAAQERLADVVPDLVILDLHLPGVNGDQILKQIRADERMTETRVIVITAYSSLAITLRDEADLVLIKPVSLSLLRRLVARLGVSQGWPSDMPTIIGPGEEITDQAG